jgi:hypothetical protein
MNDAKYIGMDVHQATISVAVRDSSGNLVMEAILETKAETILQFIRGLRGSLYVTFEEGTWAAWLHDLLQPHVTRVLVCDDARFDAGDESAEGDLPKLGYSLRWQAGVCTALPCGVACEDLGSRRTPSCRTLLSAVRRLSGITPASTTRTISGSPETSGHEITAADSLDRPHPRRSVDRSDARCPYQ